MWSQPLFFHLSQLPHLIITKSCPCGLENQSWILFLLLSAPTTIWPNRSLFLLAYMMATACWLVCYLSSWVPLVLFPHMGPRSISETEIQSCHCSSENTPRPSPAHATPAFLEITAQLGGQFQMMSSVIREAQEVVNREDGYFPQPCVRMERTWGRPSGIGDI